MSPAFFSQPRSPGRIAPRRFALDALVALRALACRLVHCRGQRPAAGGASGALELAAAALEMRRRRTAYSLLLFELSDLPELECVFGARAAHEAIGALSARLARVAGRNGRVVRTGPTLFAVLLPIANPEHALAAAQAALGRPCRVELQVRGHEIVLLPELALQTMDADGDAALAHETLCRRLQAQPPQRRPAPARPPQCLPQARRIPASAPAATPAWRQPIEKRPEAFYPATIPVPLGMR